MVSRPDRLIFGSRSLQVGVFDTLMIHSRQHIEKSILDGVQILERNVALVKLAVGEFAPDYLLHSALYLPRRHI